MFLTNSESKTINFKDQEEKLVSMTNVSNKIKIYPSYFLQKIPAASRDLFLRQGVAGKIVKIAEKLPNHLFLVLIDGWRAYETQLFLYKRAIADFRRKGHSEEKIKKEICHFVAYPSRNVENAAPHYTGGAIDLTLSDGDKWLIMGTGFDDFTKKSYLGYYEEKSGLSDNERLARDHRRFLQNMMESAGFTHNPTEWWHYSFGDRVWARVHNTKPLYGGIEKNKVNQLED